MIIEVVVKNPHDVEILTEPGYLLALYLLNHTDAMCRIYIQITDAKHGQTPVIYKAQAIHHDFSPKGRNDAIPSMRSEYHGG